MPGCDGTDDGVDGLVEALLSAVGRVVDVVAGGLADDQDVEVMRRRAWVLAVAGCPGPKDQDPIRAWQGGEFLGDDMLRSLRQHKQLGSAALPSSAGAPRRG